MIVAPGSRRPRFVFSPAGFIATRTLGVSPGVVIEWSAIWTWKLDTPASVPAGARISAGKSGSVSRSLPKAADTDVKRSPASCMPSPGVTGEAQDHAPDDAAVLHGVGHPSSPCSTMHMLLACTATLQAAASIRRC